MKILMIAPTPFFSDRGCHIRIYEEAKIIQKYGHEIIVCTYHLGRDLPDIKIERIINIPFYKKYSPGFSFHKFYLDLFLLLKCIKILKKFKIDLIHAHLHEGALIGKILSSLFKVPLIFDTQGSLVWELAEDKIIKKDGITFKFLKRVEKFVYKLPAKIITSSTNLKNILIREFGIDENKIKVIPDGVNINMFENLEWGSHPLKHLGNKKIIVYAGTLNKVNGIEILIKSAHYIIPVFKDVHFLIIGYPDVNKYQAMVQELGIENYFTFTGRIPYESLPRYLVNAHIGVAPKISKSEAHGKILHYLAAGLPVVAFDTPVNKEILEESGIYAKLSPPYEKSLAEALIHVLQNFDSVVASKNALMEKAKNECSWEKIGEKIKEVYNEIHKL